ncbi:MAG TPA: pyridoxal-phosphate dependent enzyme [Anaerolineales bacterium]|nr:pyridoxal-phosphate dependent enzyme [Anaerolineales bacterium]
MHSERSDNVIADLHMTSMGRPELSSKNAYPQAISSNPFAKRPAALMDLHPPSLNEIHSARQKLMGTVVRTPLVQVEDRPGIYLKLENLQPTGSFKVRGAGNALLSAKPAQLMHGVWTVSAGNMGQALAWYAQKLGVDCTVIVPDDAPQVKVNAIAQFGARIIKLPFAEYQAIQRVGTHPGMKGLLIHPFADQAVMAGNGTIGLEILEDLPEVQTILVPYGGGGLSCGIAAAVAAYQQVSRPTHSHPIRVEAVEAATATPLTSSLAAGKSVNVSYQASFISGMGAPFVFPQMWPLARQLLNGSRVVELEQVAKAIKLLGERQHIIAEGAGAIALAAALEKPETNTVCVVSGGNINRDHLVKIIIGEFS